MSKSSKNCIYSSTMALGDCEFMDDIGNCIAEGEGCYLDNEELDADTLADIEEAKKDIAEGRTVDYETIKKILRSESDDDEKEGVN